MLGGGPAGAYAAERLAGSGLKTILLDEKLAWEKPCGGGLTYKAYHRYPFLIENDTPKKVVTRTFLTSGNRVAAKLDLTQPLVIYSRQDLNAMLLKRADKAGAQIEKTRVLDIQRCSRGWKLQTKSGAIEADFCVVATGARNSLKEVGTQYSAADTMVALGYFIPCEQDHVDIQFFSRFEGYIWIFPRNGHLSAGICGKGETALAMRGRLERYLAEKSISLKNSTFYAHVLPSLEKPAWQDNRVAGDGWVAVGDAAGLVDPVTGEGLYYAVRSADLAARVILSRPDNAQSAYRGLVREEFTADLELASRLAKRLFMGRFLYGDVPARMIEFIRRSPTFCEVMQDLFAGTQNYLELKSRLMRNLNGTAREVLMNFYLRGMVPSPGR